jgi:hypothetical protein
MTPAPLSQKGNVRPFILPQAAFSRREAVHVKPGGFRRLIGESERGSGYFIHFLHVPLDTCLCRGYDKLV